MGLKYRHDKGSALPRKQMSNDGSCRMTNFSFITRFLCKRIIDFIMNFTRRSGQYLANSDSVIELLVNVC